MSSASPADFAALGIGGHLRVGPQYEAPTHRAVAVVQRGPHGQILYPEARPGAPGQPMSWWAEHRTTERWLPETTIVAMYGMGELTGTDKLQKKQFLTKNAKDLLAAAERASASNQSMLRTIRAQIDTGYKNLADAESSFGGPWKRGGPMRISGTVYSWSSSDVIRQNYQLAQNRVSGKQSREVVTALPDQVGPITDTDAGWAQHLPQAISDTASEYAEQASSAARSAADAIRGETTKLLIGAGLFALVGIWLYGKGRGL